MEDQVTGPSHKSPVKKNPRGKLVRSAQKQMIINLYKTLIAETPKIKYKPLVQKLAKKTGIGRETISKTLAEYKSTGTVTSPNKKKRRLNILEKTSEAEIVAIRKKIHNFWLNREIPNLKKILVAVNNDDKLPSFSETSLIRLFRRMEYKFIVRKRNSVLIEQPHIISWRQRYIEQIQGFRSEGRPIYYLDETWVHTSVTCPRDAEQRALTRGIPAPSGRRKRFIIAHIGSTDGFVPGALLCVEAKRKTGDYHDEMNGDTFFEWFQKILPMLPDGAVIVMDSAPYHSVKKEKYPTLRWKRDDIIAWLEGKGETVNPRYVNIRLMQLVEKHKKPENNYVIDEYARENGRTVLRIPPYHFELNPIELAWAQIKEFIKVRNTSYKLADVRQFVDEAVANVSPQNWQNFIHHTLKEETRLYELDHFADVVLEESPEWSNSSDDSDIDVSHAQASCK
ncbi:uncharacterized protein LOC143361399 [Halictus rubicundus]|uniref:uncharacterized protein LOC143361399 n=1 Tax=Halictus rubicundus TaxID=77578 RepID=UPI004036DB50